MTSATTGPNVATWNIHRDNSQANVNKGLKALVDAGADVIGVQELAVDALQQSATDFMATLGFVATKRNSAVTIFINGSRLALLHEGHEVIGKAGEPWEPGTGGNRSIYKVIMWVQVQDKKTGQISYHLNDHIVPGIERDGELDPKMPLRLKVYDRQIDKRIRLMKQLAAHGDPVTCTTDNNVAWDRPAGRDLARRMAKAGATCNWAALPDVDTHGSRVIDYVWSINCVARAQKMTGKFGSDHLGFLVKFRAPTARPVGDFIVNVPEGLWARNPDMSLFQKRPYGYKITTGVDVIDAPHPTTHKVRRWLVTEAGKRYSLAQLKAAAGRRT